MIPPTFPWFAAQRRGEEEEVEEKEEEEEGSGAGRKTGRQAVNANKLRCNHKAT